jgi:1-acyl-sn-glycerol-3-phosphate acyltransferase
LNFNQIKLAIYATYVTNLYGFKLKGERLNNDDRKEIRIDYARTMLNKLNIEVVVEDIDKIPTDGKYMLVCNHRSVIDPLIVEMALKDSNLYGVWVAKKELYNSFFFGRFTRNGGTILLDRESKQMSGFFKDVKEALAKEQSIFIFPEGTRNKSDEPISEFKSGSQLIAIKNRVDILPVYIESNAQKILQEAIKNSKTKREIKIKIGDLIAYKESKNLEGKYKEIFDL